MRRARDCGLFVIEGVLGSESSCFEEVVGGVVGEVSEPECGSAKVFEAFVDGLGGAVAGVGMIEVGQDVLGSAFERPCPV